MSLFSITRDSNNKIIKSNLSLNNELLVAHCKYKFNCSVIKRRS